MMNQAAAVLEEKTAFSFQPDTILPAQYFETLRGKAQLEPEKRLVLAVLEDAIQCFQNYLFARDERGKRIFREAEEWILEAKSDRVFSFDSICEVLGFNPRYVRQGLLRWKEENLLKLAAAKVREGDMRS